MAFGRAAADSRRQLAQRLFWPSPLPGIELRSKGDPVLYAAPPGAFTASTARSIDAADALTAFRTRAVEDPEIATRDGAVRDGLPHADEPCRS